MILPSWLLGGFCDDDSCGGNGYSPPHPKSQTRRHRLLRNKFQENSNAPPKPPWYFWKHRRRKTVCPFPASSSDSQILWICVPTAFLCFLNSLNGDLVHDDLSAVRWNPDAMGLTPLHTLFSHDFWGCDMSDANSHKSYRPITILTFRLNVYLHGLHPLGFHIVNVLLHCLNVAFVFHIARRILRFSWHASFMATLLFATHPVHTEAVAGIVGRADVLCGAFFLCSFISSHSWSASLSTAPYNGVPLFPLILSVTLAILALLSKEIGVTVIGISAIHAFAFDHRRSIRSFLGSSLHVGHQMMRNAVLLVTGLSLMAFRLWVLGGELPQFSDQDNPAAFAETKTRFLSMVYIWAKNILLLLNPSDLSYDWQFGSIPLVTCFSDVRNLVSFSFLGLLGTVVVWCLRQSSLSKTEELHRSQTLMSLAFFIVPFLPATNIFFPVGFVIAERVLYIPRRGVCWLFHVELARVIAEAHSSHTAGLSIVIGAADVE
ncbi:unnamed protein product [Cyprideis torosa]|uniref:Uncharacterized protein n=1 Tax=Cyprideis torosa TaxID=163714 RepID=A0A7R8ZQR5_9CRUS|nr:unnamed protein product [Cyprideis torosa]CAG0892594.1 unnamed protein product [Cyprideis torosa]